MGDVEVLDEIVIEGLGLSALIGVYAHEREATQPLLLDLALAFDPRPAARSDALVDTVDYAEVVAALRAFVAGRDDQLLERLAEELCAMLLARFGARRVRLHLRKPRAAAALGCAAVGLRVERQQL